MFEIADLPGKSAERPVRGNLRVEQCGGDAFLGRPVLAAHSGHQLQACLGHSEAGAQAAQGLGCQPRNRSGPHLRACRQALIEGFTVGVLVELRLVTH
ncbi:hypothetical protein D9M71_281050 [compost metagenome]